MKTARQIQRQRRRLEAMALGAEDEVEAYGFATAANALRWALGEMEGESIQATAEYIKMLVSASEGAVQ